jgi:hypothetical protein
MYSLSMYLCEYSYIACTFHCFYGLRQQGNCPSPKGLEQLKIYLLELALQSFNPYDFLYIVFKFNLVLIFFILYILSIVNINI